MTTAYQGRIGTHLTRKIKGMFGSRLAYLARQALNCRAEGGGSKVAIFMLLQPAGE